MKLLLPVLIVFCVSLFSWTTQEPYWIGIKDFDYVDTIGKTRWVHRLTYTYTIQAKDWATASRVFNKAVKDDMKDKNKKYIYIKDSYDIWKIDFKHSFR
jgi:hypothetical protein